MNEMAYSARKTLLRTSLINVFPKGTVNTLAGHFLRVADTAQRYTYGTDSARYLCRDVRNHSNTSLHPLLLFHLPYQIAFYQLDIRYIGMILFHRTFQGCIATFRFAFKRCALPLGPAHSLLCHAPRKTLFAFCTF